MQGLESRSCRLGQRNDCNDFTKTLSGLRLPTSPSWCSKVTVVELLGMELAVEPLLMLSQEVVGSLDRIRRGRTCTNPGKMPTCTPASNK